MMPPFVVFPTNRIAHFVEVSLYLFYLAQQVKLFKMIIDWKMTNNLLVKQAGISLNIITRPRRDEYIAMNTIEKICIALECDIDGIFE